MPENNDTRKHDETPEHGESPERSESPEQKDRAKHDESLKRMYQIKRLAMSFLKTFHAQLGLPPKFMQELDPENMELDPTENIKKEGSKSVRDLVWRIPSRNIRRPFILRLLVEIQSTHDLDMVDRIVSYSSGLENLVVQNRKPTDPEIRLRAGTLYTGKKEWPASRFREPPSHHQSVMPLGYQYGRVIDARRISLDGLDPTELAVLAMRLEQVESPGEAIDILKEVFDHYGEDDDICRAFTGRVAEMDYLTNPDRSRVSYKELREQHQGGTMAEANQTRFDEYFREHRIQAINEGRNEGQIETLCSLATMRFDAETVARFAELLRSIDDFDRITEIGKGMFKCETPEELLALVQGA